MAKSPTNTKPVITPKNGSVVTGPDGHKTPIPAGYGQRAGTDGRVVAIPPGASVRTDGRGRVVPIKPGNVFWQDANGHGCSMSRGKNPSVAGKAKK